MVNWMGLDWYGRISLGGPPEKLPARSPVSWGQRHGPCCTCRCAFHDQPFSIGFKPQFEVSTDQVLPACCPFRIDSGEEVSLKSDPVVLKMRTEEIINRRRIGRIY